MNVPITFTRSPSSRVRTGISVSSVVSQSPHGEFEISRNITGQSGARYTIERLIGKGGYGKVYRAKCNETKNICAVKVQRPNAIAMECDILDAANKHGCNHFCRLVDSGLDLASEQSFMVMPLLGPSISSIRTKLPGKKFSISTACRVAMQTLNALEELHYLSYVQRDVKPSNVLTDVDFASPLLYLIDFGISKRYVDETTGKHHKKKARSAYRGTARYCSLRTHKKLDYSRRDDLESWFYMFAEMILGKLPWIKLRRTEKSLIQASKELIRQSGGKSFFKKLPSCAPIMLAKIDAMKFADTPDYPSFYNYLDEVMKLNGCSYDDPYDWYVIDIEEREPAAAASEAALVDLTQSTIEKSFNDSSPCKKPHPQLI